MSRRDLIDPESRVPLDQLLEALPGGFNAIADIVARRATVEQILAMMPAPENPGVTSEDRMAPGPHDAPEVMVRIYRPDGASGPLPGVLYIHGGGMVLGNVAGEEASAMRICHGVGAVVVSVEYRLAPEHPHPAPVEDCYAALVWTARHAEELGIDAERLAVYGASAGGGLAIGTALLARDRGAPALAFMMPIYPMVDDTHSTPSSHEITDVGIWDRSGNIEAWDWYLGGKEADQYAAPTRVEDLQGLPPAYIDVGTVDLFRDRTSPSPSGSCRRAWPVSCMCAREATTPVRPLPPRPLSRNGSGPAGSTPSAARCTDRPLYRGAWSAYRSPFPGNRTEMAR